MRSSSGQKMFLVSAAVFLLTVSSTSSGEKEAPGSKTRSCCWPTHFQAWIGRFAGTPAGGAEDVFEALVKLWKGQTETLEPQLSRKAIPAGGPIIGKASGVSCSSMNTRDSQEYMGSRLKDTTTRDRGDVPKEEFLVELDLPRNRWGFWMRDYFITNDFTEVIYAEDHNAKTYTIANFQGCAVVPMTVKRTLIQPCIPEYAEFMETQRIGEGEESLLVDFWKWDIDHVHKGNRSRSRINASFFQGNCIPHTEVVWWTAEKFNWTTYTTFLDMNVGEGEDSPFKDLSHYYTCKKADQIPETIDARYWIWAESYYLMQRFGSNTYDPEVYGELPETA